MAHVNPAEEVEGGLKDVSLNGADPYREHLVGDAEAKTTWRHGGPPTYDVVNALFESGPTKVDENLKILGLEVFYDPTAFLTGLTKGPKAGVTPTRKVSRGPYLSQLKTQQQNYTVTDSA